MSHLTPSGVIGKMKSEDACQLPHPVPNTTALTSKEYDSHKNKRLAADSMICLLIEGVTLELVSGSPGLPGGKVGLLGSIT